MAKELKQKVMDKVAKKIKEKEFIDSCQKHWLCPECGESVKEEFMLCTGLMDIKMMGLGRFECLSCGNKFRYSEYTK